MLERLPYLQFPEDLLYTDSDEWVRVEGDICTVGITDYAQLRLQGTKLDTKVGGFKIVEQVGSIIKQFEPFGLVESDKANVGLNSPVSGEIIAINKGMEMDHPRIVHEDPYGEAWLIRVRLSDPSELKNLMSPSEYDIHARGKKEEPQNH